MGNLQSEVIYYKDQWFHPEQAHNEEPSEQKCNTGVSPSQQAHRLSPSKEYLHPDNMLDFGGSVQLPGAAKYKQESSIHMIIQGQNCSHQGKSGSDQIQ